MPNAPEDQTLVLPVFRSRRQTRAHYDKISKVYDLLAEHTEAPVRRAGLALLAAQAGETVLEVGFGTGGCLLALSEAVGPTGRTFGLELSQGMIDAARRKLKEVPPRGPVTLICGDAAQLPFRRHSMDAVFMSFTLELFATDEIPRVLREVKRVLKVQGRVVVVGMSKAGNGNWLMKAYQWTHQHFPNVVDCRPIYVAEALKRAGFRVGAVEHQQMWLPVEIVLASNA